MSYQTATLAILVSFILTFVSVGSASASSPFSPVSAIQDVPLVTFEDTGVFSRIHPTKMAIGKDRKIYFNSSLAVVYRIDEEGTEFKCA